MLPVQENKIVIETSVEQQKEYRLKGSVRRIPGLKLFELNYKTGLLREAEIKQKDTVNDKGDVIKHKIVIENPDCIYVQALNLETAKRKIINKLVKK
jgi:hypothetical protein